MDKLVSIIIPTTQKELPLAQRCADSVYNSTYKNVEVLIINEGKERSEQRNSGIARARGDYVMYLDSDQYVSPNLIKECVFLMNIGYGGIYIPEIIVTDDWFGRFRNWERSFYNGTAVDCVRFFRRKGCPRFDLSLRGPEDSDLDRRIEGIKAISKNPLYHDDGVTLKSYFAKKIYYSRSMDKFIEKWPDDKVLNWKWRCFGVFVEHGKWKRLIRNPVYTSMLFLLIFIRGIIYLWFAKKS